MPHRQIPVQLQQEVRKCLESWLKEGIIRPSKSPYASQVVIVRKKSGEIRLCVDFRKLNAISIRDSFPLPRIEEALQAVQAAVWFTSFDLAQGYLQMAMEEADIPKTAFRAGSSGLFEFTRMPFGLTNAGALFLQAHGNGNRGSAVCNAVVLFGRHLYLCQFSRSDVGPNRISLF